MRTCVFDEWRDQTLDETLLACQELVEEIGKNSFTATRQAKSAINHGYNLGMDDALVLEKNMCAVAFAHPDRLEGMSAFLEKRKANFE